jgi:hypothetical protein
VKKGKLAEMVRMCLPKKLLPRWAGSGLFLAQLTECVFWLYDVTGVELLLWAKFALSPGLAQPPPRFGEGERESDIVIFEIP